MAVTVYRVLAAPVTTEIEVRRSRFRCDLARAATEDEARAVLEAARRSHWDARHHCSAFVLGPDGRLARSSDDGEPAGTAGAPMLEVLRGAGLSDVEVPHADAGRLENDLRGRGVTVRGTAYAAAATLTLAAPPEVDLAPVVAGLTGGAARPVPAGEDWVDQE